MTRARGTAEPAVPRGTASAVARALLAWYRKHRRDLPWRRTRDPYAVWVSEVMLQQTQVATVRDYYERWMRRFPTIAALARAGEDDVLHTWQGLGYYSRARNLRKAASAVLRLHDGAVPKTVPELRALPGVGPYSAGAIASIAFGARVPIVDGNVVRVLCRFFGLRGDPARAPLRARLWQLAEALVPEERPGDFNQALMELGATVCTPRSPRCEECPLRRRCAALADGAVLTLPEIAKRPAPVPVARAAAVVLYRGRVLTVRVPDDAPRWAGMWQFPNADLKRGEAAEDAARRAVREASGLDVTLTGPSQVVRHSVTRYRITLSVFRGNAPASARPRLDGLARFRAVSELNDLAMPSAHRRIAKRIRPE